MISSTAVRGLALWKVALGAVAVAAALLAFTGAADAAVIQVSPGDTNGTDNLSNAINTANSNGAASNTIILAAGTYRPEATPAGRTQPAPSTYPTITSALNITGDPRLQASAGQAATVIYGGLQASSAPGNLFTIAPTGDVTMAALEIDSGAGTGFADISDAGKLTTYGVTISGSVGSSVRVNPGATATLNISTLASGAQAMIENLGSLTLSNSTVAAGQQTGIVNSGGTFALNNTLMAYQVGLECVGGRATAGATDGSLDDDGTCGVQHSNDTTVDINFPQLHGNGGPTLTYKLGPGGSTYLAGNMPCPVTDQRFFVNPGNFGHQSCDIGAVTQSAAPYSQNNNY